MSLTGCETHPSHYPVTEDGCKGSVFLDKSCHRSGNNLRERERREGGMWSAGTSSPPKKEKDQRIERNMAQRRDLFGARMGPLHPRLFETLRLSAHTKITPTPTTLKIFTPNFTFPFLPTSLTKKKTPHFPHHPPPPTQPPTDTRVVKILDDPDDIKRKSAKTGSSPTRQGQISSRSSTSQGPKRPI